VIQSDSHQYQGILGILNFSHLGVFMWYFSWILGVLLACAFGIINVMWMEAEEMLGTEKDV
jgi:cyd operon protein YbgT